MQWVLLEDLEQEDGMFSPILPGPAVITPSAHPLMWLTLASLEKVS